MSKSKITRYCRNRVIFIGAKYGLRLIHFGYDNTQCAAY